MKNRRIAATIITVITSVALLTGCEDTFSFEADPEGKGGSEGYEGDPQKIKCFIIEADATSDENDVDLGKFCKAK